MVLAWDMVLGWALVLVLSRKWAQELGWVLAEKK
jgi:hypothetical protein